ncbi:MAG TPA: flagellar export protein FliJ [Stellaceae bacterium]|nr:flagellar export protein FliJ [Stellaceae bacterium]
MAALHKLISVTGKKSDNALVTWQRLKQQCDEALAKLSLLREYCERYRTLLNSNLGEGMPAMSTMAYLGFIGQIEEVVLRQESEVGRLEAACTAQWQELVEIRREKRIYEIVHERATERELAAALRSAQAEIDDMLQRVGKAP